MQTPSNLIHHELIGLKIRVKKSKNEVMEKIEGTIADETKNMLIITTKNGEKKVPKKNSQFEITLQKNKVIIDGSLLEGSPEKRIKKTIPKKRV